MTKIDTCTLYYIKILSSVKEYFAALSINPDQNMEKIFILLPISNSY